MRAMNKTVSGFGKLSEQNLTLLNNQATESKSLLSGQKITAGHLLRDNMKQQLETVVSRNNVNQSLQEIPSPYKMTMENRPSNDESSLVFRAMAAKEGNDQNRRRNINRTVNDMRRSLDVSK